MLEFGATRVELGVQTLDDDVLRLVERGHGVQAVIDATRLLKQHGFKVYYHWMPGLPGMTPERDLETFRRVFDDPDFRPDGLKLYPTMVVAGTRLEQWYREGRYQPYDDAAMTALVGLMKGMVPPYVRISRVLRDIPSQFITAGMKTSLRGPVRKWMYEHDIECRCIRCREFGLRVRDGGGTGVPALRRLDYDASGGKEVFLSFEDEGGTLFGLLRLRLQAEAVPALGERGHGPTAIIRELHVYGPELPLRVQGSSAAQHRGLGKALLREAERIAREEFSAEELLVLSGVGAREYYRHEFGYEPSGDYMARYLP